MLLASPAVSQTQETWKFCVFTLLPSQYAQILLIHRKSSTHAHQLLYLSQTILTYDSIVVATYTGYY